MRAILLCLMALTCGVPLVCLAQVAGTDITPDANFPPAIAEITVPSGGKRMPGLIYLANGAGPQPTILLLHGFPGNEKNLDVAQAARRAGFNVVFFHYRGAWGAEGTYSIRQLDEDVLAVLAFLRIPQNAEKYRVDTEHFTLLGHSLGGYIALAAGQLDKDLVCVGAMSPANVGLWKLAFAQNDPTAERLTSYADSLFMLSGFNSAAMRDQLAQAPMEEVDLLGFGEGLRGKSVFLVVGDEDTVTTPQAMFDPLVNAYQKLADLKLEHHTISGDHSYSWSRLELTRLILDWLARDCR